MDNKDAVARGEHWARSPASYQLSVQSEPGSAQHPFPKRDSARCANLVFLLFSVTLVASIAFGFAFPERASIAIFAATVLLVGMAFTQLEKFESIKGAGIEFKLRQAAEQAERASEQAKSTAEQAKATTQQAKVTTEQVKATTEELRLTASTVARIGFELLAREAIAARIPDATKIKVKEDLQEALRAIGVPEDEIAAIGAQFSAAIRLRQAGKVQDAPRMRWLEAPERNGEGETFEAL